MTDFSNWKTDIQNEIKKVKASIALDWLTVYYRYNNETTETNNENIEVARRKIEFTDENKVFQINENMYLLKLEAGTQHFKNRCLIFYKSEIVGTIMFGSYSEKIFKKDVFKVDYTNETLYTGIFSEVHMNLLNFGFVTSSLGRVDIAIDGCNYLVKYLNAYVKQNKENETTYLPFKLVNAGKTRNILSPGVFNPETYLMEHFKIGTTNSKKYITIYNKSLELSKSNKKYILEYWYENGVIDINPDRYNHKDHKNIYRFELRLTPQAINKIKDVSVLNLADKAFLAGIVKRHSWHYFEFVSVSGKGRKIPLLPYEKFNALKLQYVNSKVNTGTYKAKLTVHGLVNDIYNCRVKQENVNEAIEIIFDRVLRYNLIEYLANKLPEWHNKYKLQTPNNRKNDVAIIIDNITQRNERYRYIDVKQRGSDNNQPDATARFGNDIDT